MPPTPEEDLCSTALIQIKALLQLNELAVGICTNKLTHRPDLFLLQIDTTSEELRSRPIAMLLGDNQMKHISATYNQPCVVVSFKPHQPPTPLNGRAPTLQENLDEKATVDDN